MFAHTVLYDCSTIQCISISGFCFCFFVFLREVYLMSGIFTYMFQFVCPRDNEDI